MGRLLSTLVPIGCYLIHRTRLPLGSLGISAFERRETITFFPLFLRYCIIEHSSALLVISERGNVLVLQPMRGITSVGEAQAIYSDPIQFAHLYRSALALTINAFKMPLTDFEETFFVDFSAGTLEIAWDSVSIPEIEGCRWKLNIFIEAILVYARLVAGIADLPRFFGQRLD